MRPQRLTRSISAAASGDKGAAAGSAHPAAGSAALPLDADALSSSSGECVELKARRQADRTVSASGPAVRADGDGVAPSAHGGDAAANSLKRRRSARLNGSQEGVDAAEDDDRPSNGRAGGLPPDLKRSRLAAKGPPPPDDAISLHDSGSLLPDPSSSESASEGGHAGHGDADWSPASPDAQSPEAGRGGARQMARSGSGRKRAGGSLQKRGSGEGQQGQPPGAIPSTHVACPICGRSVPKVCQSVPASAERVNSMGCF